jgi:hypothetical protein
LIRTRQFDFMPGRRPSIALPVAALAGLLIWHVNSPNSQPVKKADPTWEQPEATSLEDYRRQQAAAQDRYRYICVTDPDGTRRTQSVVHLTADCRNKGASDAGCTAFTATKTYGPGTFELGRCPVLP